MPLGTARSRRQAIDLVASPGAGIVVALRAALRDPEARPRDVAMDAALGASEAVDVLLSHVSASAIEAVCLRMSDSLDRETIM